MASTIAIYTGDGITTDFTVPFDYLAKKFVKVSVGLTVLEGGDYGDTSKDYYFLDKTTVRLKTAPQAGVEITVRRYTSSTDRIVSFKDASILKAKDLDTASIQTIHIAEEGRDVINDALIVDKYGNWDAKGNRIVNVGDPVDDEDVVNFKTYKADYMGAYQSRVEADKARDRAVEAETNAKESEKVVTDIAEILVPMFPEVKIVADNVEDVKTVAGLVPDFNTVISSIDTVTNLTIRAETAATNSESSATQAGESEANARASEAMATAKATEAKDWANKTDGTVDGSEYSAKYYANRASTASAQATIATNKATEAKNYADNAALSKDAAKTSENNAKKYAESAASAVSDKLDKAVFEGFVDYGDLGNQ